MSMGIPLIMGIATNDDAPEAPFDPSSLSGNVLWLNADNADSLTQAGGYVSAWADLSPTGATFTQGTASLQPAYVASAVNGKPALEFSGSTSGNGYLTDTGTNQFIGDGTEPFTLWAIIQPGTAAAFIVFADFLGSGAGNHPEFGFGPPLSGYDNLYFSSSSGKPFGRARCATAFGDPNNTYMITITFDGAGTYAMWDTIFPQTVTTAGDASGAITNTSIGGLASAGGVDAVKYFSELVIYNRVLSAGEIEQLQAYGNEKYGL